MGATMERELTAGQRLMAESMHMGVEVKLAADRMDELEQENAKLRELVRDMWHLMDGSGVTTGAWGRCVQILNRMRELGVEV